MFWQERKTNWIDQIRYFIDHRNELSTDELRDAFINLAYLYIGDFTSLKMIENHIMKQYGSEGEIFIQDAVADNETAQELEAIDLHNGRDILATVLETLDYIEDHNL